MPDLSPRRYSAYSTRYRNHSFKPVLGLAPAIKPSKSLPSLHTAEQAEARETHHALDRLSYHVAERAATPPASPPSPQSNGGARRGSPRVGGLSPVTMRPLTSPVGSGYAEWVGEGPHGLGRPGWSAPARDMKPAPFLRPAPTSVDHSLIASLRARIEQLTSKLHANSQAFRHERRALRSAAEAAHRSRIHAEVAQAKAEAEAEWAKGALAEASNIAEKQRRQAEEGLRSLTSELQAAREESGRYREEVRPPCQRHVLAHLISCMHVHQLST